MELIAIRKRRNKNNKNKQEKELIKNKEEKELIKEEEDLADLAKMNEIIFLTQKELTNRFFFKLDNKKLRYSEFFSFPQ